MPNSEKLLRERRLADLFLINREFRYDELVPIAPDPPDLWVVRDGVNVLAIEITEYHPTEEFPDGRVGVEKRWFRGLLPKTDELRRKEPELQPVWAEVVFFDPRLPTNRHHKALAAEMVRLAKTIAPMLRHDGSWIKVSFLDDVPPGQDDPTRGRLGPFAQGEMAGDGWAHRRDYVQSRQPSSVDSLAKPSKPGFLVIPEREGLLSIARGEGRQRCQRRSRLGHSIPEESRCGCSSPVMSFMT